MSIRMHLGVIVAFAALAVATHQLNASTTTLLSESEAAAIVGGGGYTHPTFACGGWWCNAETCNRQKADVYNGQDKKHQGGSHACGNGWGACGWCLEGPFGTCNQ